MLNESQMLMSCCLNDIRKFLIHDVTVVLYSMKRIHSFSFYFVEFVNDANPMLLWLCICGWIT